MSGSPQTLLPWEPARLRHTTFSAFLHQPFPQSAILVHSRCLIETGCSVHHLLCVSPAIHPGGNAEQPLCVKEFVCVFAGVAVGTGRGNGTCLQ